MQINLTPIIEAIISLLAALVVYKLIPWIQSKTTESQQRVIYGAVKVAVFAAEQIIGSGNGQAKMEYARKWLQDRGFDIDVDEIEAVLYEEINQYKAPPPDAKEE